MNICAISLFGFAALIATTPACRSQQTNELANLPVIAPTKRPASLINADEVFAQMGFKRVTNAVLRAHTSDSKQVVVVGKGEESMSRSWHFVHT